MHSGRIKSEGTHGLVLAVRRMDFHTLELDCVAKSDSSFFQ